MPGCGGPSRILLAGLLGVCATRCTSPNELEGTYDQETPIPATESYAYRLSLFRFGDRVGGVARFYEVLGAGPAINNTPENPFLYESFCTHFGDVPVSGGDFAFEVPNGPGGQPYNFLVTSMEATRVQVEVAVGLFPQEADRSRFALARTDAAVDRRCSTAFEVVVDLPPVSVADAPELAVAAVFAGYQRTPGTEERLVTRSTVDAFPVVEVSATEYATTQRVPFPRVPDEDGLSDPEDGVQFGVGYIVLFNDGNRDGLFSHRISGDRVLALSPSRIALYVAGQPAGLEPSIQARFTTFSDIPTGPGYALYNARDVSIEGETAYILGLDPLRSDVRVRLEPLGETNPEAFPALLPEAADGPSASDP